MQRLELDGDWHLRLAAAPDGDPPVPAAVSAGAIRARVPGCVHTDLLAAGLIADPYLDDNERTQAWIGRAAWRYDTTVTPPPGLSPDERVDLVFAGLDTFATVTLGGDPLGSTANMHRGYRFDVTAALRAGPAELSVHFASALAEAEAAEARYGPRPHVNTHPYNTVRRMACGFGWDWGPDLVTAGIWRPVRLERWHTARLAAVRPLVTVDGDTGMVRAHVLVQRAPDTALVDTALVDTALVDTALVVTAGVDGHRARAELGPGDTTAVLEVAVPGARRWWPRGHGEAATYPLDVTLTDGGGRVLDTWSRRIGFRTVHLDTEPDAAGIPFVLAVNGKPIAVRGVNWIPDDAFPHRVDRGRYAERIDQAVGAGVNLLRVWGGGIYESDDFYAECDERGVLVWQDFLFACAGYPEEEPLRGEVEAEAREAVTRLAPHPSLVLWCGGNEDIVAYAEWPGWRQLLAGLSWGAGYYLDLLPGVLAELDPTRPYLPNSPYSFGPFATPNEPSLGTVHVWDVWNSEDYTHYAAWRPRFVAEFGFQGPPTWTALTRVVRDEPLTPDSPAMMVHQKADDGNAKLRRGLRGHLPEPKDVRDWHWATQLNQARAIRFGIEHFRSLAPLCTGTVLWQLNDCWPVISWAVVDGDGRRKPAWYALREAYADRLLTIQPRDGGLSVVAVNDTDEQWSGTLTVRACAADGTPHATEHLPLAVPPRGVTGTALPARLPRSSLLTAVADGASRALRFAAEDVVRGLPAADLHAEVDAVPDGYRVHLRAGNLVRDLAVLADTLDPAAGTDVMLLTLLPGEEADVHVRCGELADPTALTRPPVLRTANDLFP